MIDKGIIIKNVYYMLSYAFKTLKTKNFESIDKEEFEHIHDLFAEIIYKAISLLLKRGIYKEYVGVSDNIPVLKGKLNIQGTLQNRISRKIFVSCEFDELSENNIYNRIIKTSLNLLFQSTNVSAKRKRELRSIMPYFCDIDIIDHHNIHWNTLKFQRNNKTYKMLLNICYFILDGMIMTTSPGKYKMRAFSEEHMNRLFEKFVLEYFRTHHKELRANADQIYWDLDKENSPVVQFLPSMQTDITLEYKSKTLIIDTKYYAQMMQHQFSSHSIHSANLYQIFTYVKNKDIKRNGSVSGMLLYALTQEEVKPELDAILNGNRIMVRTLDLGVDFDRIKEQLDNIATYIKESH